jgi:hypothetical protein
MAEDNEKQSEPSLSQSELDAEELLLSLCKLRTEQDRVQARQFIRSLHPKMKPGSSFDEARAEFKKLRHELEEWAKGIKNG